MLPFSLNRKSPAPRIRSPAHPTGRWNPPPVWFRSQSPHCQKGRKRRSIGFHFTKDFRKKLSRFVKSLLRVQKPEGVRQEYLQIRIPDNGGKRTAFLSEKLRIHVPGKDQSTFHSVFQSQTVNFLLQPLLLEITVDLFLRNPFRHTEGLLQRYGILLCLIVGQDQFSFSVFSHVHLHRVSL